MESKDKAPARKPATKKKPAAKKPAEKAPVKKKATVESIEKKYADLIAEIAAFEVDRRAKKLHANFYTRHRRQVEVQARNFSKFARR